MALYILCILSATAWLSWWSVGRYIKIQDQFAIVQPIRDDGPRTHLSKQGTPTMGGMPMAMSAWVAWCLCGILIKDSAFFIADAWLVWLVGLMFGAMGMWDDITKLRMRAEGRTGGQGISGRARMALGFAGSFLCVWIASRWDVGPLSDVAMGKINAVPQMMEWRPFQTGSWLASYSLRGWLPLDFGAYGWMGVVTLGLWSSVVVVGSANATNLTDGLDGLAAGLGAIAFGWLGASGLIVAWGFASLDVGLDVQSANQVFMLEEASRLSRRWMSLSTIAFACMGACLGFLWHNTHKASVFMGDTGSLFLGAMMGILALSMGVELLWALVGMIFVLEAVSVILQVAYFKWTRKRLFLMAPLHHHFEQRGISETKIVVRMWLIGLGLAVFCVGVMDMSV